MLHLLFHNSMTHYTAKYTQYFLAIYTVHTPSHQNKLVPAKLLFNADISHCIKILMNIKHTHL